MRTLNSFSSIFESAFVNGSESPDSLCTECFQKRRVTSEEKAILFPISFFFLYFSYNKWLSIFVTRKSLNKITSQNQITVSWFLLEDTLKNHVWNLNKCKIKVFPVFIDYSNVLTMKLYYTYFKLFIVSWYFFNF